MRRAGHDVTLIECAPAFRTGGYVIDFWGLGYRIAEKMGVEAAIRSAGYQMQSLRAVGADGRTRARLRVSALRRATEDKYTSVTRGDLAAAIYRTVENDVETIYSDTITGIDNRADRVAVTFERAPARDFDLLIGADGLHSAVRRLTFGPDSAFSRYLGCHVAACVVDGYRPREELTYVTHNVPGGHIGRFSLRDDRTLFLFIFRSPRPDVPDGPEAGRARLHREFGGAGWECPQILAAIEEADDLYFDEVSQIRLDRWSKGRVALVGDAAACVSLLAGEGTGLALVETYVLAGELHRAGSDFGQAFDAYESRLRSFVEAEQDSATKFVSFFAARSRFGIWIRNMALRATNIRPISDLVFARMLRDDIELPDYRI